MSTSTDTEQSNGKKKGYSYKKARNEHRRRAKAQKSQGDKVPEVKPLSRVELRELEIASDMELAKDLFD
jgi:hypothetical protein